MRAGKLRDLLTIQKLTVGQDAYGGTTDTWSEWNKVWGEVVYLRGRELWQAQQAQSKARGRVFVRYLSGIKPEMRIKHGDSYLEILSVLPADNKSRETEILFREWLDE